MTVGDAAGFMVPRGVPGTASRIIMICRIPSEGIGRYTARLSGAQRSVARGFRTRAARAEFVLSRAACRMLAIEAPVFGNTGRRSARARTPRSSAVTVSLSHARGVMAFATARRVSIGVDVESIDAHPRIARGIRRALKGAAPLGDDQDCWEAWCRKEALAKGTQVRLRGLSRLPEMTRACCCVEVSNGQTWTVRSVSLLAGTALAYALRGRRRQARVAMVSLNQLHRQTRNQKTSCNSSY